MAEWLKSLVGYGSSSSQRSPIESSVDQSLILEGSKVTFDGKKRTVGGGSFGTVCLGKYKGEKCAIKVFNSGVVQKNIEKELQVASIVQHHPNVVLVHGLWFGNPANHLPNDQPALVMELCSTNLWKYLNDKKEKGDKVLFSLNAKLEILSDVAAGMIYLHSEQIVHSDLTAINILLNIKGTEVVAKVADFGQARILNADTLRRITATHRKSDYMPPEVKSSQGPVELTKAVDVFSFGCLIPHVASCVYPEPRPDPLGGRSNYQMRVHYINDKQRHVFESMMKRCLEERPTARGTFEDAMEDIQVLLRKYAKNRQTETLEGRNRDIEKMKSDMLKLQRFNKDLQEEHATLTDTYQKVQEEKSSMESKMNALVGERDTLADEKKILETELMQAKQDILQKEQKAVTLETSLSAVGNVGVIFQQFNEAQAENAKLKEEVAQWKSDNQQLLQTNAEVVSKSDDYCQAEQRLQAEVNRLKAELQERRMSLGTVRGEKIAAEQQMKAAEEQINGLKEQLVGWKQKCQKAEQDLQKSKMEAQELKKTKEGMITAASQQDSKLRELTTRVTELKQQLSETKALKTAAEKERDSAIREKNETKRTLTGCQSQLTSEKKESTSLSADVKAKEMEINQLKAQIKAKTDELRNEKNEKAKLQRKKDEGDATVSSQKSSLEKLKQEKQTVDDECRRLDIKLKTTEHERDSLQQAKGVLEQEKKDLAVKKTGLEAQLRAKQDELKEAREEIYTVRKHRDGLVEKVQTGEGLEEQLKEEKTELQTQLKDYQEALERSVQKHEETKEKGEKLEEECRSLKVGFNSKEEFARQLQGELDSLKASKQELEKDLSTQTTAKTRLEKELEDEKQKYQQMEQVQHDTMKELEVLKKERSGYQTKEAKMLNSKEKLKNENTQLQAEAAQLRENLDQCKAKFEATAKERDSTREELVAVRREKRTVEEHLQNVVQSMQERQEELDASENAQLSLLQRIEDLEREKHQLQVKLTQLDEHMRTQTAKTEVELKVLSSRLTDYDSVIAENASMKDEVEKQAVAIKTWKKRDRELKEKERNLEDQKRKMEADRRKRAVEEKGSDREHLSKKDLANLEQLIQKYSAVRGEEHLNVSGSGSGGSEDSSGSLTSSPMQKSDMDEILRLRRAVVRLENDREDIERRLQESTIQTRTLEESYFESHRYPPFLYQLHQKGLPSSRVESILTLCHDEGTVEVSDISDLRDFPLNASWCDEFQLLLDELKEMPHKECQACVSISFLHCGGVITFYRYHVVLVPQILSYDPELELEGVVRSKAMLVYARTELKSNNLKEFGITPHPKGVLLQPEFDGNIPELVGYLDELKDIPADLEHTEKCLDERILHHLQCQYKKFAKSTIIRTVPPLGVATVAS